MGPGFNADSLTAQGILTAEYLPGSIMLSLFEVTEDFVHPAPVLLSESPATGTVKIWINGVATTNFTVSGLDVTISDTLLSDDVILASYFTSDGEESGGTIDPYFVTLTDYYSLDMDEDGTLLGVYGAGVMPHVTLGWSDLNTFADVELEV